MLLLPLDAEWYAKFSGVAGFDVTHHKEPGRPNSLLLSWQQLNRHSLRLHIWGVYWVSILLSLHQSTLIRPRSVLHSCEG